MLLSISLLIVLITISYLKDIKRRIAVSPRLKLKAENRLHKAAFLDLRGREITMPEKFEPDKRSLEWHFERFSKEGGS